jgi:hypothetical protein
MSARAKIKFVHGRWVKIELKTAPVSADHLVAAIHNCAARLTALEQAVAAVTNSAAPPKRRRCKSPSAETIG